MMRIELEFVNKAAKTNEIIEQNIIKAVSNFTFVFVLLLVFFIFFHFFVFLKMDQNWNFCFAYPNPPLILHKGEKFYLQE